MTLSDLTTRLLERLDDDATYYTAAETKHALNFALRLFCFLTLAIERTATFNLTQSQAFYSWSAQITDLIVPLRVVNATSKARVFPRTLYDFDMLNSDWQDTRSTAILHYAAQGYDSFAIFPQAQNVGMQVMVYYAASPAALASNSDVPEIPEEQQSCLIDFAQWWLRAKEGGAEFQSTTELLNRFLDTAQKYGEFVRARSQGQLYDRVPIDLSRFDRSRFIVKLKHIAMKERAA